MIDEKKNLEVISEEAKINEYHQRVNEYKFQLPKIGRCIVCTLRIPCKHYADIHDMPVIEKPVEETLPISIAIKGLTVEKIEPKVSLQKDRSYTVRYRGKETKYSEISKERHSSLPNSQKLEKLEKIEAYKEEKILKEIKKIAERREKENTKAKEEKIAEEKRRKHAISLKLKMEQYKEDYLLKKEQIKAYIEEEKKKKFKEEMRRKLYLDQKKRELADFIEKKNLGRVSYQKIQEFSEDVVKYKKK